MTNTVSYSVLGFLLGSSLFFGFTTFADNGNWAIGNDFMTFDQVDDTSEVNVGIGVTNPQAKLEVNGKIRSESTNTNEQDGQVLTTVDYVLSKISAITEGAWKFLDGNIYRDSGNVGIHVSDPQEELEVNGNVRIQEELKFGVRGSEQATLSLSPDIGNGENGLVIKADDGYGIGIQNDGGKGLYVNKDGGVRFSGDLGIGTDNPDAPLHVATELGRNAEINIQTGNKDKWALYHDETSEDLRFWNVENLFTIKKNGNVGIGTDSPDAKLEVNGNIVAENPTQNNHLATKEYVDGVVSAAVGSGAGFPTFISNKSSDMSQRDAIIYCADLNEGGSTNWRIPTFEELIYAAYHLYDTDGNSVRDDTDLRCSNLPGLSGNWNVYSPSDGHWHYDNTFSHPVRCVR